VLLAATPLFATTYYGGFEDNSGSMSDYDFNDLAYSISGSSLTLHTATGMWFNPASAGTLNTQSFQMGVAGTQTPFWNNTSQDGSGGYNIGWCIWGGGVCNGGVGLSPGAQYLATSSGGSVNDVYFSTNGAVTEQVSLAIALNTSTLGWELTTGVGGIHYFASGAQGPVTFNPTGDFVLVGDGAGLSTFTSNTAAADGDSHFAFFVDTPEPSTVSLLSFSLLAIGVAFKKRQTGKL
jgi:hypothetical protein